MDSDNKKKEYNTMEKEALQQLRRNLSDVLEPDISDAVLMKHLRTKNFNLRKCELQYREYLMAMRVYKTEDFENYHAPKVIENYEFANSIGIAKDGTPIHYISMGRGDLKGFLSSIDIIDLGRYCSRTIEMDLRRCKEQSKKLGKDINSVTYIIDMDQCSIRQFLLSGAIEIGTDIFRILQDYYPEVWNHIFVINAPVYFQAIFNLFKPMFKISFIQKLNVSSRENSANLLLKYIAPEVLPAFLGGKRVDSYGSPKCEEFMRFGGIIPEEYYLRNKPSILPTDPGVVDVWIPPGGYYNYIFLAREADMVVKIEVRSERGSVAAYILYKEFEDPENLDLPSENEYIDEYDDSNIWQRVSPFSNLQTYTTPINSYFYAPLPGIYVYRFQNTCNWISSTRLICRIKVLPPGSSIQHR